MTRLFTPGPVEVPEAALLAMARQVRHHRTAEFRHTMSEVFAWVFSKLSGSTWKKVTRPESRPHA